MGGAPVDVAVAFIEAFGKRDMAAVARLLADDIEFESPRVRLSGADPVVAAMTEFAQAVDEVRIVAALGDERSAVIVYDMVTTPFGTIRAVDHLLVRDGRIHSDSLLFDTGRLA